MVVFEAIVRGNRVTDEVHTGVAKVEIARRVWELAENVHFLLAWVGCGGKGIAKDLFEHYYKLLPNFINQLE